MCVWLNESCAVCVGSGCAKWFDLHIWPYLRATYQHANLPAETARGRRSEGSLKNSWRWRWRWVEVGGRRGGRDTSLLTQKMVELFSDGLQAGHRTSEKPDRRHWVELIMGRNYAYVAWARVETETMAMWPSEADKAKRNLLQPGSARTVCLEVCRPTEKRLRSYTPPASATTSTWASVGAERVVSEGRARADGADAAGTAHCTDLSMNMLAMMMAIVVCMACGVQRGALSRLSIRNCYFCVAPKFNMCL